MVGEDVNYYDYDMARSANQETQDEFRAVINSSQFGPGTDENIVKEGIIVCDNDGSDPANQGLSKCAGKDTFSVRQHLGSGIAGTDLSVGASTEFRTGAPVSFFEFFVNPSEDSDGKREVPPEEVNVSSPDLINKFDVGFAVRIINGNLTAKGDGFFKFFGNAYGHTGSELGARATEKIGGRDFSFLDFTLDDGIVIDAGNGSTVKTTGAYHPLNITILGANTGTVDIVNGNLTCIMNHSDGTVVLHSSKIFNLTASQPIRRFQCGDTINKDNTVKPGKYTINWRAIDRFDEVVQTKNFIILTDFAGVINSGIKNKNYLCDEGLNLTYNLSNVGNQNFRANLSVKLSYENGTFIKTVENLTINLSLNGSNTRIVRPTFCAEWPKNLTLNISYHVEDERNGTRNHNSSVRFTVLGNSFQTYYGSVLEKLTLSNQRDILGNGILSFLPINSSNIYVSDQDSSFSFSNLYSIGRYYNNVSRSNTDFTDIDTVFKISLDSHGETISSLFSTDGTNPKETASFTRKRETALTKVPIYRTINETFVTGILWDKADDTGNKEFDVTDKEDIVFVTKTDLQKNTKYGVHDYAVYFPAFLQNSKGPTTKVNIYLEIR